MLHSVGLRRSLRSLLGLLTIFGGLPVLFVQAKEDVTSLASTKLEKLNKLTAASSEVA